jgi:RimJ/RimL family protein N-acetyltransferase
MSEYENSSATMRQHREQMLRLTSRSFYTELLNYGANTQEILTVAEHLLDNVQNKTGRSNGHVEYYNRLFTIKDVQNEWAARKSLTIKSVSISPLDLNLVPQVAAWLKNPLIQESFYPCFPGSVEDLYCYFRESSRDYFSIVYGQIPAGIIGAENLDSHSGKLEMRKFVGDPRMHGKGIGKAATFLFLYYAFVICRFNKVYLHSMDLNIHNINLNCKFGFELEGVFLEDARIQNKPRDVIRMSLSGPIWIKLFSQHGLQ